MRKVFKGGHYIVDCKRCCGYYLRTETTKGGKIKSVVCEVDLLVAIVCQNIKLSCLH